MPIARLSAATRVAESLIEIGAVILDPSAPFTWSSGIRAPVYCDNRLSLSHSKVRSAIVDAFEELARGLTCDIVVGVATAGIAHAALLADRLDLPMAYVRPEPKGHGRRNLVEGRLEPGQRALIVEDLVATGDSAVKVVEAVTSRTGVTPVAVLAIVTYNLTGVHQRFSALGTVFSTITSFSQLLHVGLERGKITPRDLDALKDWRVDPEDWSSRNTQ